MKIDRNMLLKDLCLCDKRYSVLRELYSNRNQQNFETLQVGSSENVIWNCKQMNKTWVRTVKGMVSVCRFIDCQNCKSLDMNVARYCGAFDFDDTTVGTMKLKDKRFKEAEQWWSDLNQFDFNDLKYGDGPKSFYWKCPVGHIFNKTFASMLSETKCPECSEYFSVSFSETLLFIELKKVYTSIRQTITNKELSWLGKFSLDMLIPDYNVAIELDGPKHINKIDNDNRKDDLCKNNGIKLIRVRLKGLEKTKSAETIFINSIYIAEIFKAAQEIVNILNNMFSENKILKDYDRVNDSIAASKMYYKSIRENSIALKYPRSVKEYDNYKNKGINIEYIPITSGVPFYWKCIDCGYEWAQSPRNRVENGFLHRCPRCSKHIMHKNVDDITITDAYILKDWNYVKNDRKPNEFTRGSNYRTHWRCHICEFEWVATINNRCSNGSKCPMCHSNEGFKSIVDEKLLCLKDWDYDKNNINPKCLSKGSHYEAYWKCHICGYEWKDSVVSVTRRSNICTCCKGKDNGGNIIQTHKDVLMDWDYKKNLKSPKEYTYGSKYNAYWKCHICGNEWITSIVSRCLKGTNCPCCLGKENFKGIDKTNPEILKYYSKNNVYKPNMLLKGSKKIVNFECPYCGYLWSEPLRNALNRQHICKNCEKK